MKHDPKRREFLSRLSRLAVAGAAAAAAAPARAAIRRTGANDRIGLGLIGCGGLGRDHHLAGILHRDDLEVLAVCDVDAKHLGQAVDMTDGRAQGYSDFRALLDRSDIDAVLIATPDHWHALISSHACEAGKDVYCEKPLTLFHAEGRALTDTVRRYDRVFQTGSQQRSYADFRWACDLVRNGHIGRLVHIKASIGDGPTCGFEPDREPPAHLDWDFWLGPAPKVPYTPKRCHYNFRWFLDYSGGKMTDWGAHHLDIAQWGNGTTLSGPVEVEGRAVFPAEGLYETAVTFDVHYRYIDGVTLHCSSSGENGVTFVGTDGRIFVSRDRIGADPPEILETGPDMGSVRLEHSTSHLGNWIDCIRSRERPICDVEVGHRSVTLCHLGNIALRLRRKLAWDPVAERFIGDEEADRMLTRPMRSPWSL